MKQSVSTQRCCGAVACAALMILILLLPVAAAPILDRAAEEGQPGSPPPDLAGCTPFPERTVPLADPEGWTASFLDGASGKAYRSSGRPLWKTTSLAVRMTGASGAVRLDPPLGHHRRVPVGATRPPGGGWIGRIPRASTAAADTNR